MPQEIFNKGHIGNIKRETGLSEILNTDEGVLSLLEKHADIILKGLKDEMNQADASMIFRDADNYRKQNDMSTAELYEGIGREVIAKLRRLVDVAERAMKQVSTSREDFDAALDRAKKQIAEFGNR